MKYFFTLLVLLLFATFAHSQAYKSLFGQDSTQWNIANFYFPGFWFTDSFIAKEDTVINGQVYKAIHSQNSQFLPSYIGSLREDTIQGKAWFRSWVDTTERLVMDLSLMVGDSIVLGETSMSYNVVVDSVFYLSNRKHIRLAHQYYTNLGDQTFMFIEGEVSTMGFYFYDNDLGYTESSYLLCTHKDGVETYKFSDTCFIMSTATNKIVEPLNFTVFPNPVGNFLNIEISENDTQNYICQLIDITGKTLQTIDLQSNNENRIIVENYPSGIYFLMIFDEHSLLVGREKIFILK